jgi:hypothetical protein
MSISQWPEDPTPDRTPDRENELARAKEIIAGEQPVMGTVPHGGVTLFRGVYVNSSYQQDAEVRELTGTDEEAIARATNFLNAVVAYGTKAIGSYDLEGMGFQERLGLIEGLLVGERITCSSTSCV